MNIDYSWGEIDFVSRTTDRYLPMCCDGDVDTCGGSAPNMEADDIDLEDTVTVVWNIREKEK